MGKCECGAEGETCKCGKCKGCCGCENGCSCD